MLETPLRPRLCPSRTGHVPRKYASMFHGWRGSGRTGRSGGDGAWTDRHEAWGWLAGWPATTGIRRSDSLKKKILKIVSFSPFLFANDNIITIFVV